MIYNLISVQRVIGKVFRDLDLKEGDHRVSDMIEYAGEAMEKIGAFQTLITKVTGKDEVPILTLTDYQARLPYDFNRMLQVAYSVTPTGPFYPMRYATGSFDYGNVINTPDTDVTNISSTSDVVILTMELYSLTYIEALAKLNDEPELASYLNPLLLSSCATGQAGVAPETNDITYTISPRFIKTNQKDGYLMMAYQSIPMDGDNYPLIPDIPSFQEALYWYINMKLMYPKWAQGQVRDGVYNHAQKSWNYYCKQAYGDAMMPNQDQMESIKNVWLKLVPEINQHSTFFNTLGQQETVYNHNRV
jgi:hypothetical protein